MPPFFLLDLIFWMDIHLIIDEMEMLNFKKFSRMNMFYIDVEMLLYEDIVDGKDGNINIEIFLVREARLMERREMSTFKKFRVI